MLTIIILGLAAGGGFVWFWKVKRPTCDPRLTIDFAARRVKFNWYCKGFLPPEESKEYYGRSTYGSCQTNGDCIFGGCNSEICQSKDEEGIVSICLAPDKPTPKQLGYDCRCVTNQCQWTSSEISGWKTYSYEHCGGEEIEEARYSARFSIKLPGDWVARGVSDEDLNTYYEFTGPQGWFQVTCGYGGGGAGCPKYSTIRLKNREIEGCLGEVTEEGEEKLSLGLAFLDVDEKTGKTFAFDARLKSTPENEILLEKILASFELE